MTKTFVQLLSLIQAQPPSIPRLVWAGAILFLLIGASLLVYYVSRLKKGDKEAEEDWSLSRRSLFVDSGKTGEKGDEDEISATADVALPPSPPLVSDGFREAPESTPTLLMEAPKATGVEPQEPAPSFTPPSVPAPSESAPRPGSPARIDHTEDEFEAASVELETSPEPTSEAGAPVEIGATDASATQLLVSEPSQASGAEVFGDDVWAELDRPEPEPSVRVSRSLGRQPFEAPTIRPLAGRETFEPPRIDRILPGSKPADRGESARVPENPTELAKPRTSERPHEPIRRGAHSESHEIQPMAAHPVGVSTQRRPSGSVLGLPLESSDGPLILGEPVRPRGEGGIAALSNYGREASSEGGRGGAIALLVTVFLVAGAVSAYLFVPSVHTRVDSVIARLRGNAPPEAPAPAGLNPKAQVFPGRSEAVKNVVKARGAIYNITKDEALENLSVEVALEKGGNIPPDTRTVPVNPSRLEPQQQGRYEFEYDGSRDKGYPAGYRITKLLDKDGEVKFTMPGQQKSQ